MVTTVQMISYFARALYQMKHSIIIILTDPKSNYFQISWAYNLVSFWYQGWQLLLTILDSGHDTSVGNRAKAIL